MKKVRLIYSFLSFLLSIVIIMTSCLSFSISVKANPVSSAWEAFDKWCTEKGLNYFNVITFTLSQYGALVDGEFDQWLTNQDAFLNMWNEDNVILSDDSITLSGDLVEYIKQALKEYQNEKYGYQIIPTIKYDQIPVSECENSTQYRTICELACKYGMIGVCLSNYSGSYRLTDLSKYLDGESAFYITQYNSLYVRMNEMDLISWSDGYNYRFDQYTVSRNHDAVLYTWEDVASASTLKDTTYGFFYTTFDGSFLSQSKYNQQFDLLVSSHGEDILAFNNSESLKNYSVDKRGIFTTSGFYDQTGPITIALDDLNKSIDDLAGLLEQFKDLIGDQGGGLTEEQLQKLLEQFLEEFFKRLGEAGGNGDNQGGGNTGTGGGSSAPFGWFDEVLDYLKNILKQLKSIKRWTVVNTVINGVDAIADWLDLIHDILSDVDDGMESAVATLSDALDDATGLLKSKFPFSVPWDIFFFVTLLAAEPETPYFEVPIDFDVSALDMHIHYDFVVDFSDYQYLSDICRVVLSMTYAVGLMKMTAGIVSTKKEE